MSLYAHEAFACLLAYDIHPRRQSFPRRNAQGDSAWLVLLSRRVWKSPASGISSPLRSVDIRQMHRHLLAFYGSPLAPRYAQSVSTPSQYKAGEVSIVSPLRSDICTVSVPCIFVYGASQYRTASRYRLRTLVSIPHAVASVSARSASTRNSSAYSATSKGVGRSRSIGRAGGLTTEKGEIFPFYPF